MTPDQTLQTLDAFRQAVKTTGVEFRLEMFEPIEGGMNSDSLSSGVWLERFFSSIPGQGAVFLGRLIQKADELDVNLRLICDDDGSGKLIELYERFGFQLDLTGNAVMTRLSDAARWRRFAKLVKQHGGDVSDVPNEARAEMLMTEAEYCGHKNAVPIGMRYRPPSGQGDGFVELTDMVADKPGQGHGAMVVRKIAALVEALEIGVHLRPVCVRSRQFFVKHGFADDMKNQSGFMTLYPTVSIEDARERMRA